MLDRPDLNSLPIEVLFEIFSYLSPEEFSSKIAPLNKMYYEKIAQDNPFWQVRFNRHFPHLFNNVKSKNDVNWYAEFREAYDHEYLFLPKKIRELFSLVKEEDIAALKKILQLADLDQEDVNKVSLYSWAICTNNQLILDCIYQVILNDYSVGLMVDTAKTDDYKRTILHWAVACKQPENYINLLILQGADVNAAKSKGVTPLHLAAEVGHLDIVNALLAKGANINAVENNGATPLYSAVYYGQLDVVNVLLAAKGININAAKSNGETPLHIAAEVGHLDVVNALLAAKGININAAKSNGATPLLVAAEVGHLDVVNALLAKGADVNAAMNVGATPLYVAAKVGNLDVVNALLANDADINAAAHDGVTPLYIAAREGHLDVVNVLLAKDADINAAMNDGATPLYIAAYKGNVDVVKALLAMDADINALRDGISPLDIANKYGHTAVVKVITKAKFLVYSHDIDAKPDNYYKTSFTLFSHQFNFGSSAKHWVMLSLTSFIER